MDSALLLVVDHSPERAEEVNSLLRNSGIKIRTIFAQSTADAEKIINSNAPLLVVYNSTAWESAPVTEILELSRQGGLQAAVRFSPENPAVLIEAMTFHSCIAINADEDDHLIRLVRHLLISGSANLEINQINQSLEELQSRYNLLLDSSREAIAYIHEGLHVYANQAYLDLVHAENFAEVAALSLLELVQSESTDLKSLLREMNAGTYPEKPIRVMIKNPAGDSIDADLVFSAARFDGEDCIQMLVRQVDASAVLKNELDRLRRIDPVTQLANRKTFVEVLSQLIENGQAGEQNIAVLYLETDGLQEIHERFGVAGFDQYMIQLARQIESCTEEGDLVARFNDSGIAILANRGEKGNLNALGESILSALDSHIMEIDNQSLSPTCSIGLAMIGPLTRNADEAISNARSAFNEAAADGNCLRRFKPAISAEATDSQDAQWVERIRYALDNRDLYSIQQSIVNLEGESEGLFENRTFLREENADLPAEQFMAVAERNDLGATIDRHIIAGLLPAIAGTGDRHIINLSVNSLLDFSFPSWFHHQLDEHGVLGSQLVLQLSAHNVEPNLKPARRLIDELNSVKCLFSLSAFDEQRKTCALLEHLDIAMLKLRPGLTDDLANNSTHQEIVRKIVTAADSNQVSVIADDVKDAGDLAVLWQCGVKLVSGEFLKESTQVVGQ